MTLTRKRWLYVAVGAVMMLSLGTMYAWSIFRAPFAARYPEWTVSDLSLNFTISLVCYCLGGFLGGRLSARTNNGVTTLAGAALILAGFWGVSLLPAGNASAAKWLLYLFYGICSGLGTGLCYNGILTGVAGWFPDKNGLATGVLLTGFGFGSLLVGQLADVLIPVVGLDRVFRLLAVAAAVVLAAGARFVRLPGKDAPLPAPPAAAAAAGQRDYTPGQMVRRPSFWVFFTWNLLMCSSGLMVINSAASIAAYYGAAAVLGLLLSVFNGGSRLPFGILADKFGWRRVMLLANALLLLCGALLTLGGLTRSAGLVLAGMLIMGVCYGNSVTMGTLVIRQFYGSAHYGTNLALLNCCAVPASFIGPMISSALQEASGGGYTTTFAAILLFAAADLAVALFVKKP